MAAIVALIILNLIHALSLVDECQNGEEYMSNSRSCDQCPQRYYKDTVGNTAPCRQCPPGFTTPGKGAQSPADCKQSKFYLFLFQG